MPLVDVTLLGALAPVIRRLTRGAGKTALAKAPSLSLPDEIVRRAKTGFGVPTGALMATATGASAAVEAEPKGLVSRRWSRLVLARSGSPLREAHAV